VEGSSHAPEKIMNIFNTWSTKPYAIRRVSSGRHIWEYIEKGFEQYLQSRRINEIPIVLGGDHTVAIASVSAGHEYSKQTNKSFGVLWCDAHADFNTIATSPTGNLHGVPVSVLCGHTLPSLCPGAPLQPNQFAYYGIRDMDTLEFQQFQEYNMTILESQREIDAWLHNFDEIHVSFDLDCFDPSVTAAVNTPVPNGKSLEDVTYLLRHVVQSRRLVSMDIVEYNPLRDNDGRGIRAIEQVLRTALEN